MGITASANFSDTDRKLAARARGFAPDLENVMDRVGRLVAVSLATSAQPYGIGPKSLAVGQAAVVRDIYRVYATPGQAYKEILSNAGKPAASAFYSALKTGNVTSANYARYGLSAAEIMKRNAPRFGLAEIGFFDNGTLHKARRNNRGRVPPTQKVLLVVTNVNALQKYILDEMNMVGFGKAGWGNCARAFKDAGATRGLPEWVTRHRGAPAGVAKDGRAEGTLIVTMFNQVSYAENLLTAGDKAQAIGIGVDRLTSQMIQAERKVAAANPLS
jgi:hypothetical protein